MPERSANINFTRSFRTYWAMPPGGIAIYSSDYHTADEKEYRMMVPFAVIGRKSAWATNGSVWNLCAVIYTSIHGMVFTDVGMAYEIFSLRFLRQVVNDALLPLQAFANGCKGVSLKQEPF